MATMPTLEQYLRARYAETGETEFRLILAAVGDKTRVYIAPTDMNGQGLDVTVDGNRLLVRDLDSLDKPSRPDPRRVDPI